MSMHQRLVSDAVANLRQNDRGGYTVPTKDLYPFQWNWDSCLTAIGQRHVDEARAWQEIETLLDNQWPDGMVPHIVFHEENDNYFPGPDVWQTGRPTPTSGITQPPVLAYAMRRLFDEAKETDKVTAKALELLPKAAAWHRWFYRCRDPEDTGLIALLHPWESGRDNSIDWDQALAAVPTEGVLPYVRRDILHVDASERPTSLEYDRYLWLLQHFRSLDWDNEKLHDASPFQVVDPGFNAILIRADQDLAFLAERLGRNELAEEATARSQKATQALECLWHEGLGQYACFDRAAGHLVDSASVGGLLPVFAQASRSDILAKRVDRLLDRQPFGVASHDPDDPRFDGKRYWRGPSWLIINSLLTDGLCRSGHEAVARRVTEASLRLIQESGFAEYYDPRSGAPHGGRHFTWTAAVALDFLTQASAGQA
ncbi:MAG: amylo-alpha-1,6-glucosidase [Geminicoccaceae bacterium]